MGSAFAQINEKDSLALIALFDATSGAGWVKTWETEKVEDWHGVVLTADGQRVSELRLAENNLVGALPAEFFIVDGTYTLDSLRVLDLSGNVISDSLPEGIGNFSKLTQLDLSDNQLEGSLPSAIKLLDTLLALDLGANAFSGEFPVQLLSLGWLEKLILENNEFTGNFPDGLNALSSLTKFDISGNNFTGTIDRTLYELASCDTIDVSGNQLQGYVSDSIRLMTNLAFFDVSGNQLDLLPDLKGFLPSGARLVVSGNRLDFGDLEPNKSLIAAEDYSSQQPVGEPIIIALAPGLDTTLAVQVEGDHNHYAWFLRRDDGVIAVGGDDSTFVIKDFSDDVSGFYGCTITNDSVDLTLSRNLIQVVAEVDSDQYNALVTLLESLAGEEWRELLGFEGPVALWNGVTLQDDKVVSIDLSNRSLSGSIPRTGIDALEFLTSLNLSDNSLGDSIPSVLGQLVSLTSMDLSGNALSDTIPNALSKLLHLTELDLSGNQLTSFAASELFSSPSLEILDLSSNQLSDFPEAISVNTTLRELNLSSNAITGEYPPELSNLESLSLLDIGNNNISGSIPSSSFALTLVHIDLSNNKLRGAIPATLFAGDKLVFINLSGNEFSSLGAPQIELTNVTTFDVSDNRIESLPDLTTTLDGEPLIVSGNRLDFGDLEMNEDLFADSTAYGNQAMVDMEQIFEVAIGNDTTLTVSVGGAENRYRWFKICESDDSDCTLNSDSRIRTRFPSGGEFIDGTKSIFAINFDTLTISYVDSLKGTYSCLIENESLDGFLVRNTIQVVTEVKREEFEGLNLLLESVVGTDWRRDLQLTNLPVGVWPGIQLEESNIVSVDFSGYAQDLSRSGRLPSDSAIANLEHLQFLDLSENNLSDSLPEIFGSLRNLEVLNLSDNQLTGAVPYSVTALPKLKELRLNRNQLTVLPDTTFSDTLILEVLDVSANRLDGRVPDWVLSIDSLRVLDLSDNSYDTLDFKHGLSNLLVFDISNNSLEEIILEDFLVEDAETSLRSLQILDMSDNGFGGSVPPGINKLTNLRELDLSDNALTEIFPAIDSLSRLETLNLSRNQLDSISAGSWEEPNDLPVLRNLFLSGNNLTWIPPFTDSEVNRMQVRVRDNRLTHEFLVPNYKKFQAIGKEDNFLFAPQQEIFAGLLVNRRQDTVLVVGDDFDGNEYNWTKDPQLVLDATTAELALDNIEYTDHGIYRAIVTNPDSVFQAEKFSMHYVFDLQVEPPLPTVERPLPFCIGSDSVVLTNDEDTIGVDTYWYFNRPAEGQPDVVAPTVNYVLRTEDESGARCCGIDTVNFRTLVGTRRSAAKQVVIYQRPVLELEETDSSTMIKVFPAIDTATYRWFVDGLEQPDLENSGTADASPGAYQVQIKLDLCTATSDPLEHGGGRILAVALDDSAPILYPNPLEPAGGPLNLRLGSLAPTQVTIYSLQGEVIDNRVFLHHDREISLSLPNLSEGTYFVAILQSEQLRVRKLLVAD